MSSREEERIGGPTRRNKLRKSSSIVRNARASSDRVVDEKAEHAATKLHSKQQSEQQKVITMTQLMNKMRAYAKKSSFVRDTRGLSTVEYVIILVLIAAAAVGSWTTLGGTIKTKISDSQTEISSANVK
jgi:Flp pilus assembly pilin Flp